MIKDTITVYRISASFERDGQVQDCSQAEVLGDAYGKTYFDRADAEEAQEECEEFLSETDLDPSTEYFVEEVALPLKIEISDVNPDGPPSTYEIYLCLDVTIDGKEYSAGCMVGAPESMHGTIIAAQTGMLKAYCSAWWVDASDWADLPQGTASGVMEALGKHSWELFCEACE